MGRVMKDTPLMELTLRRYEKPYNLETRELLKKFCLSVGLLQPGDSRDIIVDVLHALLKAKKERRELTSEEIRENVLALRKEYGLALVGVAGSNIRRQIKRLRDIMVVEKNKNRYRITEFGRIHDTFDEKISRYVIPTITSRIGEYCSVIDSEFTLTEV